MREFARRLGIWCARCQYFLNIGQVLASPKQFAIDKEARHAEYAGRFGGVADCIVLAPAFGRQIIVETSYVHADLSKRRGNGLRIFNVELTSPKAFENQIMVSRILSRRNRHALGEAPRLGALSRLP